MWIRLITFIFLLCPIFLKGMIVESPKFTEIKKHIEKREPEKVVIACDIDNTLLRGSQHIGSVAWGDHIISELVNKGISKEKAEEIESILWQTVQPFVKVENVDSQTPAILGDIQNRGFLILGLTARCPEEADYTINQLLSIGINLGKLNRHFTFECLKNEEKKGMYKQGILFSTPFNKKSHALFKFLDENKIYPEHVIFIDDKLCHVEDLSRACNERNISFCGIRFSGADEHVKAFNHQIADIQWALFPSLISDEQAEQILISLMKYRK